MILSELQRKDIVNMANGKKLGRIVDASINERGLILYFSVLPKRLFRFFRMNDELQITFEQIKKIGEDVILVSLDVDSL